MSLLLLLFLSDLRDEDLTRLKVIIFLHFTATRLAEYLNISTVFQ